ncbi:MAG: TetR/AcrR family transcriptional regulator [Pseudomonadota bacterium]
MTNDQKSSKRQRRKEERPSQILEASLEVFGEKGFHASRIDDVAERAGIAKGTVYLYFDSKEALFEAAVRERFGERAEEIEALIATYEGPSDQLIAMIITGMYEKIANPKLRTIMRVMLAEGANFPNLTKFYHREVISRMRGLVKQVIARGIERGEFDASAATELPVVIMAPGLMGMMWQILFSNVEDVPLERFRDAHLALVLNGLRARPAPGETDRPTS